MIRTLVVAALTFALGYLAAYKPAEVIEVPVYLTGKTDPLLCLKGKRT